MKFLTHIKPIYNFSLITRFYLDYHKLSFYGILCGKYIFVTSVINDVLQMTSFQQLSLSDSQYKVFDHISARFFADLLHFPLYVSKQHISVQWLRSVSTCLEIAPQEVIARV